MIGAKNQGGAGYLCTSILEIFEEPNFIRHRTVIIGINKIAGNQRIEGFCITILLGLIPRVLESDEPGLVRPVAVARWLAR
jgi:hypothetical protein